MFEEVMSKETSEDSGVEARLQGIGALRKKLAAERREKDIEALKRRLTPILKQHALEVEQLSPVFATSGASTETDEERAGRFGAEKILKKFPWEWDDRSHQIYIPAGADPNFEVTDLVLEKVVSRTGIGEVRSTRQLAVKTLDALAIMRSVLGLDKFPKAANKYLIDRGCPPADPVRKT